MKRIVADHKYIEKSKSNMMRFKLTQNYRNRLAKKLEKGEEFDLARKHAMVTRDDKPKKSKIKNEKAKQSKAGPKGREKLTKIKSKETK